MKKLSAQAKHNLILSQFTAGLSPSVIAKKFKDIVGCSTVSGSSRTSRLLTRLPGNPQVENHHSGHSLLAVWNSITVEEVCAACGSAVKRFKAVVMAKGHFEI